MNRTYKQCFPSQTSNTSNGTSLNTTEVWVGISHLVNKKKQKNMTPRGEVKVNNTSMGPSESAAPCRPLCRRAAVAVPRGGT
jgi:hypothetical protein